MKALHALYVKTEVIVKYSQSEGYGQEEHMDMIQEQFRADHMEVVFPWLGCFFFFFFYPFGLLAFC